MRGRWIARPVSADEAAVLRATLRRAPLGADLTRVLPTIDSRVVVDRCECGCATVDFESELEAGEGTLLADGVGRTSSGLEVGIIVWGTEREITSLEIYDFEPKSSHELPRPDSIVAWEARGSPTPER